MRIVCIFLVQVLCVAAKADFQGSSHMMPFDEDTIGYNKTPSTGVLPRLQEALAGGKTNFTYDEKFGYLPSLLKALGISQESQVLVFSKTSLQRDRISPENPRALFFNDDLYVG